MKVSRLYGNLHGVFKSFLLSLPRWIGAIQFFRIESITINLKKESKIAQENKIHLYVSMYLRIYVSVCVSVLGLGLALDTQPGCLLSSSGQKRVKSISLREFHVARHLFFFNVLIFQLQPTFSIRLISGVQHRGSTFV